MLLQPLWTFWIAPQSLMEKACPCADLRRIEHGVPAKGNIAVKSPPIRLSALCTDPSPKFRSVRAPRLRGLYCSAQPRGLTALTRGITVRLHPTAGRRTK